MVPGCSFEPSVAFFYAATVALPEAWSVIQYVMGAPDATKRVFAFQIFVLGGGSAYRLIMLACPRDFETHLQQMFLFEWLFVAGLVCSNEVSATLPSALKIYVGCKLAGFAWCWLIAGSMRALGIARFAREPLPDDGAASAPAADDKKES